MGKHRYYMIFPKHHPFSQFYVAIEASSMDQAVRTAYKSFGNKYDEVIREQNFIDDGFLGQLGRKIEGF